MVARKPIRFDDLNVCGVYCITCIPTGKIYVGSSNNIEKRWKSHVFELNNNKHTNFYLQNSWNKYGRHQFNFSILEFCNKDEQFEVEQKYLDILNPCDRKTGFNIATKAAVPPMSKESRRRQGDSLKSNREFMKFASEFLTNAHKNKEFQDKITAAVKNSPKVKEKRIELNNSESHKLQVQKLLEQVHNDPRIQNIVKNLAKSNVKKDSWRAAHGVKEIVQLDLNNNLIQVFSLLSQVKKAGFCRETVADTCKGKRKGYEYKGFKWMYLEDYNKLKEGE